MAEMKPEVKNLLQKTGQEHLLEKVSDDPEKISNLEKCLEHVENSYPGGLACYVEKAKVLLADSVTGKNPFEGFKVSMPSVETLDPMTDRFRQLESIGLSNLSTMVYVLVAGGLGERLGYSGIKVELLVDTISNMCYLEYYVRCIRALDDEVRHTDASFVGSPLLIMTSDDTYEKTLKLLKSNGNFGMKEEMITIMKQEKVPALMDVDARFAIEEDGNLIMKPHGHGDVHQLLFANDKITNFVKQGKKSLFLFQDTNALCYRVLPATLGVHISKKHAFTNICIPRKAKESVGSICNLSRPDGSLLTINVEYNQLGPLLDAEGLGGDVGDENGNSKFPGNTNILLIDLPRYAEVLEKSKGVISEFVNPKYNDDKKTFKSPTRLECMMQDYPKDLRSSDQVGCVVADRFMCFSTLKNNNKDAQLKIAQNNTPESAFSAEADLYNSNTKMLEIAMQLRGGVLSLPATAVETYNGVSYPVGPRIVLYPEFGLTITQMMRNIDRLAYLAMDPDSVLVLESGNMVIRHLRLNGILRLNSAFSRVIDGNFVNDGLKCVAVDENEDCPVYIKMRGYKYVRDKN